MRPFGINVANLDASGVEGAWPRTVSAAYRTLRPRVVVLIWTNRLKRVITGADILGRLLIGIAPKAVGWRARQSPPVLGTATATKGLACFPGFCCYWGSAS
jgi:hypothetical protein